MISSPKILCWGVSNTSHDSSLIGLSGDDATNAGSEVCEVRTRTRAEVEHAAARRGEQPLARSTERTALERPHETVVVPNQSGSKELVHAARRHAEIYTMASPEPCSAA